MTWSGPGNTCCSVCLRKPHWPHLTKASCWECAFLSRFSLPCPGPPGVLGLRRPFIGTGELTWASGAHWNACPCRTRAGFCPQEKKVGPAALFLKGASQVCFQLRKFCHSKVFLLTQKPQGEIGDVFLCPWGRSSEDECCSPSPQLSHRNSLKSWHSLSIFSAL